MTPSTKKKPEMTKRSLVAAVCAVVLKIAAAVCIGSIVPDFAVGGLEAVAWTWLLIDVALFLFCRRRGVREAFLSVLLSWWIAIGLLLTIVLP